MEKEQMRTNMDPLTPATSTLSPAISHIAETAAALSASITEHALPKTPSKVSAAPSRSSSPAGGAAGKGDERERQRQTVRWVLDAPRRLRARVAAGEVVAARTEWEEVRALLARWAGVQGVEDVKVACEEALAGEEEEEEEDGKKE